jgi:hypothetical protein
MKEKMKSILLDAYKNPVQKRCFYTANQKSNELLDWMPEYAHEVEGDSTCIFPLGLGCQRIETSDGREWAQPLFEENDSTFHLDVPDVYENRTGEILREIQRMVNTLPPDEKIREPDIQSPLGIAEIICGQSLYTALLLCPDKVHRLLGQITDFVIAFIKEMRHIAGERLNGCCFPRIWNNHEGTLCSDDSMTLVSPEMHLEFSVPYINRIAEECGPLFYHSCSWRERYFENINKVENVRAYNWNPANSCDPALIIKEFSGLAVLAPHLGPGVHLAEDTLKWGFFKDETGVLKYLLDNMQENTTFYFWLADFDSHPHRFDDMIQLLASYGYSPEKLKK